MVGQKAALSYFLAELERPSLASLQHAQSRKESSFFARAPCPLFNGGKNSSSGLISTRTILRFSRLIIKRSSQGILVLSFPHIPWLPKLVLDHTMLER